MTPAKKKAKPFIAPRYALRVVGLGTILLVCLLCKLYVWWSSPERLLERFRAAAQAGDAHTMLALADKTETAKLGIDEEMLQHILSETLPTPGAYRLSTPTPIQFNENQWQYNRGIEYHLLDEQGQSLPAIGSPCELYIMAYRTDKDSPWRVQLSGFLLFLANYRYPGLYITLLHKHGLPLICLDQLGKSWQDLTLSPRYKSIINSQEFATSSSSKN